MATLLFIDTNIWLDFYRSNNDAGLSLLNHVKELSKFIVVTEQVEMEFRKNRQEEIVRSVKGLTAPQGISVPAFLTTDDVNGLDERIREAQRLVGKLKSRLPHILDDPLSNDPVYQICETIFGKTDDLRFGHSHPAWEDIQSAARNRYQLGYPPRKADDTSMGDSVNWEWIVYCAKSFKKNIAIVSRDGDYGRFHGEKGYLNDHLKHEFENRVGKERKISLHQKLTVVLKQFKVHVTEKEQQEENRIIQSAERHVRKAWQNSLLAMYAGLLNSPVALAAEAAAKASPMISMAEQAAKSLASHQVAVDSLTRAYEAASLLQKRSANALPAIETEKEIQGDKKEDPS